MQCHVSYPLVIVGLLLFNSLCQFSPAFVKGLNAGGMKWVSGFPENVPKRIPTIVGLIVMNDMETGII